MYSILLQELAAMAKRLSFSSSMAEVLLVERDLWDRHSSLYTPMSAPFLQPKGMQLTHCNLAVFC